MKHLKLEQLEEADFTFRKAAFHPKALHCTTCGKLMKQTAIEVTLDEHLSLRINGFACGKCKKQYLGLEEATKMDKALLFSRALKDGFKLERSLSFDGDNYTFRVPKEFTKNVKKRKIEITPLGAKEFCAIIE